MFVVGQNSFQQLDENSSLTIEQIKKIDFDEKIQQICLNWSQQIILTQEGKIIIKGLNKEKNLKTQIKTKEFFISISTSFSYTAAISKTKKLFLWKNYNFEERKEIQTKEEVKQVSLADDYILFLTETGNVFYSTFEDENFVQLKGDAENVKIRNITSGSAHSIFIDEKGDSYSFGWNGYGQCSFDSNFQFIDLPVKIDLLENIRKVSCGSHHTLFLTEGGDLYACGDNKEHQLGIEESSCSTPVLVETCLLNGKSVELENVVDVACGIDHSVVIAHIDNDFYCLVSGNIPRSDCIGQEVDKQFWNISFVSSSLKFSVSCGVWNIVFF